MKKTQKKLFGLFGLGVVVATTAVALALPSNPEALATSTVVDTITVTVVGTDVDATIVEPLGDPIFVTPEKEIIFKYHSASTVTAVLEYTNKDGNKYTYPIADIDAGQQDGTFTGTLNLADYRLGESDYDYGYGEYKLIVTAVSGSLTDTDYATFSYYPVIGDAAQEEGTDTVNVDLSYDQSDASIIDTIVINVSDGDEVVKSITVNYPADTAQIDFSGLESGNYKITVTAYDENGLLYKSYTTYVDYVEQGRVIPVPNTANTGGMFKDSNISQTDYLVTGLIIFGVVAVAGVVFIMRNDKKTPRAKKANRRK